MTYLIGNFWLFILITSLVFIGGSIFLFSTGYLSRMMDWIKPNSGKLIPVKIFCEDRNIRERKLSVGKYVISDHKNHRSFYLVQKLLMAAAKGKVSFLALTERSARPLDILNKMTEEDWGQFPDYRRVFLDTTADICSEAQENNGNTFIQALTIIALAVAIIVVIMGIIIFIQ